MKRATVRKIFNIVVLILVFPYLLALLYLYIPAPSTLMIGRFLTFQKVERDWVQLEDMSPYLKQAVVVSEDSAFCEHFGFDFNQLGKSIDKAWRRNRTPSATSTITQQLVKNLFFWPGRSWVRKVLETPLTIWLEFTWPKEDILETYLNVAEWGPGIFGAEEAARYHFGVSAKNLSMNQAALLASALPNPIQRVAGRPGPAQTLIARNVVYRIVANGADLSCIR